MKTLSDAELKQFLEEMGVIPLASAPPFPKPRERVEKLPKNTPLPEKKAHLWPWILGLILTLAIGFGSGYALPRPEKHAPSLLLEERIISLLEELKRQSEELIKLHLPQEVPPPTEIIQPLEVIPEFSIASDIAFLYLQ